MSPQKSIPTEFKSQAERDQDGALMVLRNPRVPHAKESALRGAGIGAAVGNLAGLFQKGGPLGREWAGRTLRQGMTLHAAKVVGGAAAGAGIGALAGRAREKHAAGERGEALRIVLRTRPIIAREAARHYAAPKFRLAQPSGRTSEKLRTGPHPADQPAENHTLRNAALAGAGIAGGLYAVTRLGPTYRGGKWRALGAFTPGMIEFGRTSTELLKTRRVPWVMKKTGHGPEIRYSPRATVVKDPARRAALAGYTDGIRDARASIAANVKRDRKHRLTLHGTAPSGESFAALTPRMIVFDRPRTSAGTFAGGDTAGSPADMTAAYGHPQSRPAALTHAIAGGAAAGGAGALTAAALAILKKRKK